VSFYLDLPVATWEQMGPNVVITIAVDQTRFSDLVLAHGTMVRRLEILFLATYAVERSCRVYQ
jgi:hypothetical protein